MNETAVIAQYRKELLSLWEHSAILCDLAQAANGSLTVAELLPVVRDFVTEHLEVDSVLVIAWAVDEKTLVCGPKGFHVASWRPHSSNLPYDGKSRLLTDSDAIATDPFLRSEGVAGTSGLSLPLVVRGREGREVIGALLLVKEQGGIQDWLEHESLLVHMAEIIALAIQTAAAQAEKQSALLRLAAGVAHEVKNRLAIISGEAQYLLSKVERETPLHESAEAIKRNMDRADTMVRNLLTYASEEKPKLSPVSVNRLVQESLQMVATQAASQAIDIVPELASGLPEGMVDEEQMERVFLNILLNACDAMSRGGKLTVTTALPRDNKMIEASFSDTGGGIQPDNLPYLFDPFFTTKSKGTGLGLAVCKGIVERHGGKIRVEGEPGKGTTFIVKLPVRRDD